MIDSAEVQADENNQIADDEERISAEEAKRDPGMLIGGTDELVKGNGITRLNLDTGGQRKSRYCLKDGSDKRSESSNCRGLEHDLTIHVHIPFL